jgi:hypothetical protein
VWAWRLSAKDNETGPFTEMEMHCVFRPLISIIMHCPIILFSPFQSVVFLNTKITPEGMPYFRHFRLIQDVAA